MYLKKNSVDFMLCSGKCYWIIQTIWWFVVTYLFISYKDVVVNSQIFLCNFSHYQTYSIRINGHNPEMNVLTTLCMEYESAGCTAEPGVNELSLCWSYESEAPLEPPWIAFTPYCYNKDAVSASFLISINPIQSVFYFPRYLKLSGPLLAPFLILKQFHVFCQFDEYLRKK